MQTNNPPRRKFLRLKGYDYSQEGGYFITIVTQLREPFFGKIDKGEMIFSDAGKMVISEWLALPVRFPDIDMDVFQLMPTHLHGVILIHNPATSDPPLMPTVGASLEPAQIVGAGLVPAPHLRATTRVAPTLGEIIGAFKSITTHEYIQGVKGKAWHPFEKRLWQHNYYEHIIRNEADYERIAAYILDNPANWDQDAENPTHR
jgi:putative transposase